MLSGYFSLLIRTLIRTLIHTNKWVINGAENPNNFRNLYYKVKIKQIYVI